VGVHGRLNLSKIVELIKMIITKYKETQYARNRNVSWFSYDLPIGERLQLIKDAGFDATGLWWDGEDKHMLPLDGTINWENKMQTFKQCKAVDYFTLEVDIYRKHEKCVIYENLSAA